MMHSRMFIRKMELNWNKKMKDMQKMEKDEKI